MQPVIEIALNQSDLQRLGVSPSAIGTALKTAMGGVTVFDIQRTDDQLNTNFGMIIFNIGRSMTF